MLKELKVFDSEADSNTYENITLTPDKIVEEHRNKCKEWKIDLDDMQQCLPYMYWVPKMHKNPSKQRFIAASARCSTKQLSSTITKCLKEIDTYHAKTGKKVYSNNGINSYWIIGNSSKVHRIIDRSNERKNVENIATYDFSTLYTNIPHDKLKKRMETVIQSAYNGHGKKYLSVYNTKASFVNNPKKETKAYSESQLIEMVNYLIDNCYVTCGNRLFRQKIGIPMGTDCAPFLANLFLFSYEHEWMMKTAKVDRKLAKSFNDSVRYIDDLLTINNDGLMKKHMNDIYPKELDLKHENSGNDKSASYLDLKLDVTNKEITKSLYDKRDDFPFKIVNFPNLSGNIPQDGSYGVFIAQTLRYAKACSKYTDFIERTLILKRQLVRQNFKSHILDRKLLKWMRRSEKATVMKKFRINMTQIISELK